MQQIAAMRRKSSDLPIIKPISGLGPKVKVPADPSSGILNALAKSLGTKIKALQVKPGTSLGGYMTPQSHKKESA